MKKSFKLNSLDKIEGNGVGKKILSLDWKKESFSQMFDLSGCVAVITGGAGFLGQTHAEAIAEAGGTVVLADIRGDLANQAAKSIEKKYKTPALGVRVDITSKADIERTKELLLKKYGRIDILINNAANDPKVGNGAKGGSSWTRLENFPLNIWNRDMAVGLTGAFLCSQVIGSVMAKQGRGVILNISSDLGIIAPDQRIYEEEGLPLDRQPVKPVTYSVIKTGLIGLTRYLATYWAKEGVRVNALCPGGIEAGQPEEFKIRLNSRIPMGRMAYRNEYKGAVVFLVSKASSYMTGSVIAIDGGRTCW